MATEQLAIATLALVVFSEMKQPLKGHRAFLAGMVLCTAACQLLLWAIAL